MFLAFDAPVPFSTMGRRNVSNVPGQALTLMNDPLVIREANLWAKRLIDRTRAVEPRASWTISISTAFGRPPSASEARASQAFLAGHAKGHDRSESGPRSKPGPIFVMC